MIIKALPEEKNHKGKVVKDMIDVKLFCRIINKGSLSVNKEINDKKDAMMNEIYDFNSKKLRSG